MKLEQIIEGNSEKSKFQTIQTENHNLELNKCTYNENKEAITVQVEGEGSENIKINQLYSRGKN